MEDEHKNDYKNNENSREKLPLYYPLFFSKNKFEPNLNNRINKESFYYIYNLYHRRYMKNKNNNINIPRNFNNKESNNMHLSFNKTNNFIKKRKQNSDILNSLSMIKNNLTNNDSFVKIDTSILDKKNKIEVQNYEDNNINTRKKLKKSDSFFIPYTPNLNLSFFNHNNKIPFPNKLVKNQNNNSTNYKKGNKDKSWIFQRNLNKRLFSSKSFCSNNKNLKLEEIDNGKNEDNNFTKNYINKETIYRKKMEKIDKYIKILNEENQRIHHHLSFNKGKDIQKFLDNSDDIKMKSIKNSFIKENKSFINFPKNNNKIFKNKKIFSNNNNLINKNFIFPKEEQIKIGEKTVNLNNQKIKYSNKIILKINLEDNENRKNIHRMIKYVLNYNKFKEKESEKELNKKPLEKIKMPKKLNIPSEEKNKEIPRTLNINKKNQMKINREKIEINNNNIKIKKMHNISVNLKNFGTIPSERYINSNNKSGLNNFNNKIFYESAYLDNKTTNHKDDISYKNDIKNKNNNSKMNNGEISYKFANFNEGNYSVNNITKNNTSDNENISNIRRYLNNYYEIKYRKRIIKNNSVNFIGDKSFKSNETCYYNLIKNNLLKKLIKDENIENKNDNTNNNNNYYNNLSSNVNINININPNDISNKNIDINLINSNRNTINKYEKNENSEKNNLQLLTPTFEKTSNEISEEKVEKNHKKILRNNELSEFNNYLNNYSFISYHPENNNKFPIYFGHDYTFKNMNINYKNKLTKKKFKNSFGNEKQINEQNNYNINQEKRNEDIMQLFNFSQNLGKNENKIY